MGEKEQQELLRAARMLRLLLLRHQRAVVGNRTTAVATVAGQAVAPNSGQLARQQYALMMATETTGQWHGS